MDDSEEKQSRSSPCLHCLPRLAPFFHPFSQFNDFPQALLGCSKINKASFRALGKNLSFCHPWSLLSHSSSRKPSSPDLCCFSLLGFEAPLLALCPGCCFGLCVGSVFTLSAALLLLATDIGMLIAPRYVPSFLSAHVLINNSVSASLISLLERYNCFKDNKTQKFYSSHLILTTHLSPLTSNGCVIFVVTAKKVPFLKTVVLCFGPVSPTLSKHGMCIFRHSSSQFLILVQWISPSMCLCFVPQHQPYYLWLFLHFPALHSPKADTNQTDFFTFFFQFLIIPIFFEDYLFMLIVAFLFIFLISLTTCQFIFFHFSILFSFLALSTSSFSHFVL